MGHVIMLIEIKDEREHGKGKQFESIYVKVDDVSTVEKMFPKPDFRIWECREVSFERLVLWYITEKEKQSGQKANNTDGEVQSVQ